MGGHRYSGRRRDRSNRQMAARQCAIAMVCSKLLQVDSRKEHDCLVSVQQVFVYCFQVAQHYLTTII